MKFKRGQAYLGEKTVSILIAVVCILLLFVAAGYGYSLVFGSKNNLVAQGWTDDLADSFEGLSIGEQSSYSLLAPDGWLLVLFKESDARKPRSCDGPCICICPGKTFGGYNCDKAYCRTLSKDLQYSGEKTIKIPADMSLKSIDKFFTISLKAEIKLEVKKIETNPAVETTKTDLLSSSSRPQDTTVDRIVLHHTGGDDFKSAYDTLKINGLSVHYMIEKSGEVHHLVDEKREAYHAGNSEYNARSIGIEIVNSGNKDDSFTNMQYTAIKSLIEDIAKRWTSIKIDNEHVIGHFEIKTAEEKCRKWDPSLNFDWAKIGLPNHVTPEKECPNLIAEMEKYGYAFA